MQAERARRIEEKRQRRKYERQMQRRQEYVTNCREELEDRRRKVSAYSGSLATTVPMKGGEVQVACSDYVPSMTLCILECQVYVMLVGKSRKTAAAKEGLEQ